MTGLVIKGACLNIYIFCWQAKDVYSVTLFVLSSQCGLNSSSDGRTGSAFTQKAFLQHKPNSQKIFYKQMCMYSDLNINNLFQT